MTDNTRLGSENAWYGVPSVSPCPPQLARYRHPTQSPNLSLDHESYRKRMGWRRCALHVRDIFCWFSLFKAVPPMNDNDLVMKWVLITRLPTRLPPSLSPFPSFPFSSFPLLSSPHWRCATATYSSTSHGRRERKSNSCSDSHMSPPPTVEHLICVKRNRRRVRRGGVPGGAAATKVIEIRARPGKEACIVTLHRAAQLRPDRL